MATVSNEVFMLAFTYILIYILIYREHKIAGNLVFAGLGALTFLITDIGRGISFVLTILPLINLLVQWLNTPIERK